MSALLPLSLSAADTGAALIHTKGGVWVNGSEVPDATSVFSGDVIQTKPESIATLDADGSSVLIQPESVVKFNGDSLTLEHGSVSVGTSKSLSVHVNCLTVIPVANEWTHYDVTDVNGTVQVAAQKNDVNIRQGATLRKSTPEGAASQSATVREGEHATRDESAVCGAAQRPGAAGSGLNMKWVEIGGAAAGGGIILCLLLCRGSTSPKVSPDTVAP